MTTINDLNTSIIQMSSEELFNFIRTLRERRRFVPPAERKKKPTAVLKSGADLISKLTTGDREKLLKILEEL